MSVHTVSRRVFGALGLTGCELRVNPLIYVPITIDAAGNGLLSVPFGIPANSLSLTTQVAHLSTSNPLGWATTNMANSVIGTAGLVNVIASTACRSYGPTGVNEGPAILFR